MSIAGYCMHCRMVQQKGRSFLGARSPAPAQRVSCDLHYSAALDPLKHALELSLKNWIALGMSNDRSHSVLRQFVQQYRGIRRHYKIAELHQQITGAFDAITFWINQRRLKIFIRKVEVASQAESQRTLGAMT